MFPRLLRFARNDWNRGYWRAYCRLLIRIYEPEIAFIKKEHATTIVHARQERDGLRTEALENVAKKRHAQLFRPVMDELRTLAKDQDDGHVIRLRTANGMS